MIQLRIGSPGFGQLADQVALQLSQLRLKFRMRRRRLLQRPAEQAAKPGVDIAERRLARFAADGARHDAAVDLAADAFNRAFADLFCIGDQDVAGRGADHFHQRIGLCACADGAHMAVERAAGNGDALLQAEPLRPVGAQRADRNIGGPGIVEQRRVELLGQQRVERVKKVGVGQPLPVGMPQRLMPGGAAAAAQAGRGGGAAQQRRHPVAQLNP